MQSFEQMENDAKVDAELQRLMAEMGAQTDADIALEEGGVL